MKMTFNNIATLPSILLIVLLVTSHVLHVGLLLNKPLIWTNRTIVDFLTIGLLARKINDKEPVAICGSMANEDVKTTSCALSSAVK